VVQSISILAIRQQREGKGCLTLVDLMGGALLVLSIVLTAVNAHVVFYYFLIIRSCPSLGCWDTTRC
jgi:hypothetical protein